MAVRNRALALVLLIGVALPAVACSSSSKSQSPPTTAEPGRHPGQIRPGPPTTVRAGSATIGAGAGGT
jgi:hypothetical protein